MTRRPRLLLVYPSTHRLGWVRRFQLPSLSLKQVAAVTPAEWDVVLADELHEDIPFSGDFDAVGITAMTHQAVRAYQVAEQFRSRGIPVILGGMHATVLPDEALQHVDAVVIGEAEPVWARLLSDVRAGTLTPRYSSVPAGDNLVIPWSRRDILAGRSYLTTQTLQASRGCPYDCPFCTVTPYFGRSFRYRDPEDVLAELRSFDRKLTVLLDDNILGDPERAKPILKGMAGMGLRWGGQANLRFAEDPELVHLLAQSGCIGIFVGLESVAGAHANHPKTGSRFSQADLIKRVRDAGIVLEASMIFGFDDHDEGVFESTIRYLEECRPSIPTFHILTPYPGTALFRQFDGEGRLLHKDWQRYDHNQVVFRPRLMSPERLYQGWVEARREVYRWPSILSRVMAGSSGYATNLAYNVLRRGGVYGEDAGVNPPRAPESLPLGQLDTTTRVV